MKPCARKDKKGYLLSSFVQVKFHSHSSGIVLEANASLTLSKTILTNLREFQPYLECLKTFLRLSERCGKSF